MTDADWHGGYARSLAVFLNGVAITERGTRGEPVRDNHFLLLFNAHSDACSSSCPAPIKQQTGMLTSTRRRRRAGPARVQAVRLRCCPAGQQST